MAPKKSSKASSPSWRTLRRQADQAPTSAQAAALVKEANRLRRAKRAKTKAAAKAGPKKPTRKMRQAVKTLIATIPKGAIGEVRNWAERAILDQHTTMRGAQGGPVAQTQGWAPIPTHDELIAQGRAEEITKLARSKGGAKDQIVKRLECWSRIAEVEARKEAEVGNMDSIKMLTKQMHINVVASFLAQINGMAAANRGPLPRSMVISGYTLARVVDALTQAGYTEDGFKSDGIRRLDREAVVDQMVAERKHR